MSEETQRAWLMGDLAKVADWWSEASQGEPASPDTVTVVTGNSAAAATAAAAVIGVGLRKHAAEVTAEIYDDRQQLDFAAWMDECDRVRDLMTSLALHMPDRSAVLAATPDDFQTAVDEILTGAGAQLLDGPVAAAAALLASEITPECVLRLRPLQPGVTPVEEAVWQYLQLEPILRYRTRLADASLAPLAHEAINLAVALQSR